MYIELKEPWSGYKAGTRFKVIGWRYAPYDVWERLGEDETSHTAVMSPNETMRTHWRAWYKANYYLVRRLRKWGEGQKEIWDVIPKSKCEIPIHGDSPWRYNI